MFWLVIESFKTSDDMGPFFGVLDLGVAQWMKDEIMAKFKSIWDHYVENLGSHVASQELRNILLRQLEKSNVLKPDIAHFHRVGIGDKFKTYEYLYSCMVRQLDLATQKRNRQAQ